MTIKCMPVLFIDIMILLCILFCQQLYVTGILHHPSKTCSLETFGLYHKTYNKCIELYLVSYKFLDKFTKNGGGEMF